ncbi:MAG: nucleoside hydrolase, partial [Bacteroidota bacterium]
MKITTTLLSILILLSLHSCTNESSLVTPPIQLIFDTDFGGDADDLGALAMLNHFENRGEMDLLAVMCWNTEKYAVGAIDAVNTYYENPNIPIGLRQGETHETHWNHSKVIAEQLKHDISSATAPDATQLYRKILSKSEYRSVVIVTVGPLMNIKALIDSPADIFSPLSGADLIHQKVKEFVIMGGNFPEGEKEWNFDGDMPGVTKYVLENL